MSVLVSPAGTSRAHPLSDESPRREPRLRVEGAGLTLWANATAALDELGLGGVAESVGVPFDGVDAVTTAGRAVTTTDLSAVAERYGVPHVHVHRGELLDALGDAAGDCIVTGRRCVGYRADDRGVAVEFSGAEVEYGDVLVGVDGAGSTVRGLVAPADRARRSRSWAGWQGIVPERPAGLPARDMLAVLGKPTFAGLYPLPGERTGWFLDRTGRAAPSPGPTSTQNLLAWLAGWPTVVREAIAATPRDALRYDEIRDHVPVHPWGVGRVTLLGDAAHAMLPTLGQGACQAIEDVVALVDALTDVPEDPAAALRAYEERRAARVAACVRGARRMTATRTVAPAATPLVRLLPGMKALQRRMLARYM